MTRWDCPSPPPQRGKGFLHPSSSALGQAGRPTCSVVGTSAAPERLAHITAHGCVGEQFRHDRAGQGFPPCQRRPGSVAIAVGEEGRARQRMRCRHISASLPSAFEESACGSSPPLMRRQGRVTAVTATRSGDRRSAHRSAAPGSRGWAASRPFEQKKIHAQSLDLLKASIGIAIHIHLILMESPCPEPSLPGCATPGTGSVSAPHSAAAHRRHRPGGCLYLADRNFLALKTSPEAPLLLWAGPRLWPDSPAGLKRSGRVAACARSSTRVAWLS